ncbi:MAG: 3-deoxy-manno-octulosonate cytidylyltransferase [Simkania negevensis]|nr:3-deoxy-manno-octulosonate cytidylyltransferase [Simkania negevensis]
MKKKIVCVIPARLASKRFPKKVLSTLGSKPLLQWVWEAAKSSLLFDEIAFAIDDLKTARLIESFQGRYFMTSLHCKSGTERLIELMQQKALKGDIWVNWQGDEPFITKEMIATLLQTVGEEQADVWTLKKKISSEKELTTPHIVKVVTGQEGKALYFSRSPIPFHRDLPFSEGTYYKHIGIYAYTEKALEKIALSFPSFLEEVEQLEQLRFLEGGLAIQVHESPHESLGIDTPLDLLAAIEHITVRSSG